MNFGQQALGYTLLQEKYQFPSKEDQKVEFRSKGNFELIL
jgi:hypothetical protein